MAAVAAAVPWIQATEDVVGENEPSGHLDVSNRPLKFIMTQSDLLETSLFPGFMVTYKGGVTPEGSIVAAPASAFVDVTNQLLYIKMTGVGNTGWKAVGNVQGNGSPEGVITAPVGKIYEQQDATTTTHALWVKHSGVGNTGWRNLAGFGGTSGTNSIEIGLFTTGGATANDAISIGRNAAASGIGTIAMGFASAGSGAGSVAINGSTGTAVDAVAIKGSTVDATASVAIGLGAIVRTGSTNSVCIGNAADSSTGQFQVVIGRNATGAATSGVVVIGNGASLAGSSGVAILGTCSVGGSTNSVVIAGSITGGAGAAICIGGAINPSTGCVLIGMGGTVSAANCILIGNALTVAATGGIGIGGGITATHTNSIAIGNGASSIAAQTFSVGSNVGGAPINQFVIGNGLDAIGGPTSVLFRITNSLGADNAAGNYTIQSGLSTGLATPGVFKVQTGDKGATSSTLQTATVKFTISETAAFTMKHTPGNNNSSALVTMTGTIIEHSAGVHPRFSLLELIVPTITAGAATLTDTAMLYIPGPMTGVVTGTNYSMWVAGGASRFDGDIYRNGAAATVRDIFFSTAFSLRWILRCEQTAEGGADAGSNFALAARTDAGAAIDDVFTVARVAGGAMIINRPTTHTVDRGILFTNQTSAAAAAAGTLANSPTAGNPGHWLKIKIGGTNYAIPCWLG